MFITTVGQWRSARMSTIKFVPPAIGVTSGPLATSASSASGSVRGISRSNSGNI
jgi:hypothetical protein